MPDALSTDPTAARANSRPQASPLSSRERSGYSLHTLAVMLLLGYLPLLHVVSVVVVFLALGNLHVLARFSTSLAVLYLVPPLVVRICLLFRPLPQGNYAVNSRAFLYWWFTAQWQLVFCRLPLLEELLRLMPGLYSAWLRLWGARVGKLVYWSPGVLILDRPLLEVGDQVMFGAGVRVNAHVLLPGPKETTLALASIRIGARATLGGYSLIMAGTEIAAGEATPPLRMVAPPRSVRRDALAEEPLH